MEEILRMIVLDNPGDPMAARVQKILDIFQKLRENAAARGPVSQALFESVEGTILRIAIIDKFGEDWA